MYLVDLAAVLATTGYPVKTVAGWQTRGHGGMDAVRGILCHHTGGPRTGEYPSLNTVVNGRPDLAGPLCNFGIGRSGTLYVVAAGAAWHAGTGIWSNIPRDLGNQYLIGIEAESDGSGTDWTEPQLDSYAKSCSALAKHYEFGSDMVIAHREYATPAGRKVDPTGIDMPQFRSKVAALRSGQSTSTSSTKEWYEMALDAQAKKDIAAVIGEVLDERKIGTPEERTNQSENLISTLGDRISKYRDGTKTEQSGAIGSIEAFIANAGKADVDAITDTIVAALAGPAGQDLRNRIANNTISTFGTATENVPTQLRRTDAYFRKVVREEVEKLLASLLPAQGQVQ